MRQDRFKSRCSAVKCAGNRSSENKVRTLNEWYIYAHWRRLAALCQLKTHEHIYLFTYNLRNQDKYFNLKS